MKWHRKFDMELSEEFKNECTEFVNNNEATAKNTYYTVGDSDMWIIWLLNQDSFIAQDSKAFSDTREHIKLITGLNLKYHDGFVVIWRFDEHFDECPTHIDSGRLSGGAHNGSVCIALNGSFKINLRTNESGGDIIEEVIVDNKSIVTLNNTVFPHNVEGCGDLIVFGVDTETHPEDHWYD